MCGSSFQVKRTRHHRLIFRNWAKTSMERRLTVPILFVLVILIIQTPLAVHAWQLGGNTYDSVGHKGILAGQLISGNVPSPQFFGAISAFYDNSGNPNIWHAIAVLEVSNGGSLELEAEWVDAGGYHDVILCTGLSRGTYYSDQIYWSSSNGAFIYKTTTTSCNTLSLAESGAPTISGSGSWDFMESNDNTASDFQNSKAYAYYSPTVKWYSGGLWYPSADAHSHNIGDAPSSMGMLMTCSIGSSAHILTTKIDSPYAPPPAEGAYVVSC